MIRAEIITTGEEVIAGELVDSNSAWISQQLVSIGIRPRRRTTVGDNIDDLSACFRECGARSDLVIVNGGLGPTTDDLSAEAAARALDEPREINQAWLAHLKLWFDQRDRSMPESNRKQAFLPRSATLVHNSIGTACGFRIQLSGAQVYFTPGVPRELKVMVRQQIIPDIRSRFDLPSPRTLARLHSFGISEARMGEMFSALPNPDGIDIGYRAHLPFLEIKLSHQGASSAAKVNAFIERVPGALTEFLVARDQGSLAGTVSERLRSRGATIAVAESCTGGLLADAMVHLPGSSDVLVEGVVAYSNASKTRLLGVRPEIVAQHGAVSMETAIAMAEGAAARAQADFGLSTTGVAGPGGGTDDKPVGTLAIGLATPNGTYAQMVKFPDFGRTALRRVSVALALDFLRRVSIGIEPFGDYDLIRRCASQVPS